MRIGFGMVYLLYLQWGCSFEGHFVLTTQNWSLTITIFLINGYCYWVWHGDELELSGVVTTGQTGVNQTSSELSGSID
jgi:hypothetical protein